MVMGVITTVTKNEDEDVLTADDQVVVLIVVMHSSKQVKNAMMVNEIMAKQMVFVQPGVTSND
jgi:hypothetical protein